MIPDTDPITKESTGHIDVYYNEIGAIKYRRERAFTLMQLIGKYANLLNSSVNNSLY
jgi:hypothetical protein